MITEQTVMERIVEVIGTQDRADDWLDHMSNTLGAKPRDLIVTESGREDIMLHLQGIERNSVTDL